MVIDIDQLGTCNSVSRFFGVNCAGLMSFHESDHGPRDGSALRPWLDGLLAEHGLERPAKILLQTMPRVLGYVFNPISLWYCFDGDNRNIAVLVEVHNTFSEQHCYLLSNAGEALGWPVRQVADKVFHVSPFMDMHASYEFRISDPECKPRLVIHQYKDGKLMLVATQTARRMPLTGASIVAALFQVPFSTLKVILAIHWQALKIWRRGGTFYRKPAPPDLTVSAGRFSRGSDSESMFNQ